METNLICINEECYEVPIIQLVKKDNNYLILTDCPYHHYKFKLDIFLQKLKNQKKEYNYICYLHNYKYEGFLKNCNVNYCKNCNEFPSEIKISFNSLEDLTYLKKFENELLSKLYAIIVSTYLKAKNQNKMVSAIYLNLKYLNSSIDENTKNSSNKAISFVLQKNRFVLKENDEEENDQIESEENDDDECDNFDILANYVNHTLDINYKYIIQLINNSEIKVSIININQHISASDKFGYYQFIEFSPIYEQIFLTISLYNIKIWEIDEEKKLIVNKITIYFPDRTDQILFAKFSPINEKILFSVSSNNIIQIWNLEKIFNAYELDNINHKLNIKDIVFSLEENIVGFLYSEFIIIYNIKLKQIITKEKAKYRYFNFLNSEEVIIIYNKKISIISIENKKTRTEKIEFIEGKIIKYNIDNNLNLLYIFSNYIYIVDLDNKNSFQLLDKIEININSNFSQMKILKLEYNNIVCIDFLISRANTIYFYSAYLNKINNISINLIPTVKNSKYFWINKVKRLYRKCELNFENKIIEPTEIYKKKYLDNRYITQKVKENYKINLDKKKENVFIELKNYKAKDTITDEYFHLLEFIIQDNTNKDLIIKYLQFLKKNENNLKGIYFEKYENELKDYKVLFTKDELQKYLNVTKEKTEKEEFITFINKLLIEKDVQKIKDKIDASKFGIFNQNIYFNNDENEFYWHRNMKLLLYAITKFGNDQFNLMKYCIHRVIKKGLLNKDYILSNQQKLTFLMINMVVPQEKEICEYNLNLVNSTSFNNEGDFIKRLIELGFKKKLNNDVYYLSNENNIIDPKKDINICIDNFILNEKLNLKLQKHEMLIFDEIANNFFPRINITKLKRYFINFLNSNLFKEVFTLLYSEDYIFPFKDEQDAENYVNKKINYLPIINLNSNGVTDKFTLETYIFLKKRKIHLISPINDQDKEFIYEILYSGAMIKTNFHELNHNLYNICYYHSNGLIPLKTPQKKKFGKMRESGREIEYFLFGEIVSSLKINQIRYILNENNFNKGVIEFKDGFKNLKEEDLIIHGEFECFNEIIKNKNFDDFKDVSISTEIFNGNFNIEAEDGNDTFGW